MRIGIDIDDTICDTWEYSLPFFSKYFEINLDELKERIRDRYDIFGFPHEAYLRFLSDCYEEFINDVPLKKGAKEAINKLKENGVKGFSFQVQLSQETIDYLDSI